MVLTLRIVKKINEIFNESFISSYDYHSEDSYSSSASDFELELDDSEV